MIRLYAGQGLLPIQAGPQLQLGRQFKLAVDRRQVRANGGRGNAKPLREVMIGSAICIVFCDFGLARAERILVCH